MSQLHEFQKKIRHITTYKLQKIEKFNRFRNLIDYKAAYLKAQKSKTAKKSN